MRQKENLLNKCERQAILSFGKWNKTVLYEKPPCPSGWRRRFGAGRPGFDLQSRHCGGHCGVPLDKAHFLAYNWFV